MNKEINSSKVSRKLREILNEKKYEYVEMRKE